MGNLKQKYRKKKCQEVLKEHQVVNVSLFMSAKLVARWAMPAGNSTAWNMESSLMDKCLLTKPLVAEMTHSIPFSQKLDLENTYPELYLLIWNPPSLTKFAPELTASCSTLSNW